MVTDEISNFEMDQIVYKIINVKINDLKKI